MGKLLYDAASLALIDTISQCCQMDYKAQDLGDGSVDLVFSSRSSLDYEELRGFIDYALTAPEKSELLSQTSADIIRPSQIQAIMHSKSMGLQIADAITSSYFYAVEPSQDGFTEDAYVRLLLPCAFQHSEELIGRGMRFDYCSEETVTAMRLEVARWQR